MLNHYLMTVPNYTPAANRSSHEKIYWQVGNRSTYSKSEALIWSKGDLSKIHFNFFDKEWQDRDWSQAPKKSLETLIVERCLTLRNQTNNLTLWLSSGYDSVTILNKFAKYKIKLDEIVTYCRRPGDPEFDFANAYAADFKKNFQPTVKLTEIKPDYKYHAEVYRNQKEEFLLNPGFSLKFTKTPWTLSSLYSDLTARQLSAASDKINLCGFEKPKLDLYNGRWYSTLPDDCVYDLQFFYSGWRGFWCDVDAWELYHATCWSAIDWFETLINLDHDLLHRIQSHDPRYFVEWNLAIGRDPVYNSYSSVAQGKKFFHNGLHSPDSIPFETYYQKTEPKIFDAYVAGLKIVQKIIEHAWQDWQHPAKNLTVRSTPHYIRDQRSRIDLK